ncbi:methylated-DNA--[protein]-cysteine S-methyltransferase [uncultured Jatrophihabitans sp.]|uniref:methylated-DNA--[protein]-cysteine S-methyltransferase n=1 Tax=uncultured Jatrophihabitans sp. TaxID=1610747 RepID=UPI0035C943D3
MTIWTKIDSPLGLLLAARDAAGITTLLLPTGRHQTMAPSAAWARDDAGFDDLRAQLEEYFAGRRTEFDLTLNPVGTAFQLRVWTALADIPYGRTASYAAIAVAIGAPRGASRAVGAANGQNPISIVVPCHRVVGAQGALTGYAGGLPAKQWLLGHEAQHAGLFAPS